MLWAPDGSKFTKCCNECGRLGVTRHDCPDHPCNYCKRDGHVAKCCPKLENRGREQRRGLKRSSSQQSPPGATHSQPPAKRECQNSSSSSTGSAPDPKHQIKAKPSSIDIELAAEALQIRNETYLPPLGPLANHVVQILSSDACPKHFVYFKLQIARYSSSRILADIISAIDTTICTLEAQVIDCHTLQRVREIQKHDSSLFDCDGGYMDFVTDSRSDGYFKMYIGQAQILAVRIGQHRNNVAIGDITTLHYFILATGGAFRSLNFIRLFRLDSDIFLDQEYAALCRSLLEFLMTLAFQTLPAIELQQWLPAASIRAPLRTLHLNVLNPLYQNLRGGVTYHIRHTTRDVLLASPDPQLARWPVVRKQQIKNRENQQALNRGPYPKLHQMSDILGAAIEANQSILGELDALQFPRKAQIVPSGSLSMHDRLARLRTRLQTTGRSSQLEKLYTPVGGMKSPLAMVLNRALIPPKYDRPSSPDNFLPLTFEEMGLTDGQLLIWPFNLRYQSDLAVGEPSYKPDGEVEIFKKFSLELLNESCACFILVAEGAAQESLFNNNPLLSAEFELTLRSFKIKARLLTHGKEVQKVFLIIPDPETLFFRGNFRTCQRFTHALRMAGFLSGVQGQRWKLFEQKGAHAMILRAYAAKDTESVSLNTLDQHIVEWLYRKGFQTAEDVRELQDLSPTKSLIEACFMLMVLIPKDFTNIDRKVLETRGARSRKSKSPKIPNDTVLALRQLFQKKSEKILKNGLAESDSANIPKTLEDNPVDAQIVNERGMLSHEPLEAEVAEILAILEDNPDEASVETLSLRKIDTRSTKHWTPNPKGIGLNKASRTNGGRNSTTILWSLQRDQTVEGLLTGKQSFSLAGSNGTRHISLSGWGVSIIITCPVSKDSSIYVTADISLPSTQHEHTCFGSDLPRLHRLAFRIRIVSQSGQFIFWAQRVKFQSQEMLEKLFDQLIMDSDSNCGTGDAE